MSRAPALAHLDPLPGVDVLAVEVRLLLDLVSFELQGLAPSSGAVIGVRAAAPALVEGLRDRLWPEHRIAVDAPGEIAVHLLDLEESGLPQAFTASALVIAFRNAWSHKHLVEPGWRGLPFDRVERRVGRDHPIIAARGVMTPATLAGLAAAGVAHRAGRHDLGVHWADRALRAPGTAGAVRRLCPYGLIVARRR